jgi:hypothetical protein
MNINLDFDTEEFLLKPYVWKQFFHTKYEQKYYNCSFYIEINWLWFGFDITIPYKRK